MDIEIPVQFLFYDCVTGFNILHVNGINIIIPVQFIIKDHQYNPTLKVITHDK